MYVLLQPFLTSRFIAEVQSRIQAGDPSAVNLIPIVALTGRESYYGLSAEMILCKGCYQTPFCTNQIGHSKLGY